MDPVPALFLLSVDCDCDYIIFSRSLVSRTHSCLVRLVQNCQSCPQSTYRSCSTTVTNTNSWVILDTASHWPARQDVVETPSHHSRNWLSSGKNSIQMGIFTSGHQKQVRKTKRTPKPSFTHAIRDEGSRHYGGAGTLNRTIHSLFRISKGR